MSEKPENKVLWLGIDVGSTTVKAAVMDPVEKRVLYSRYERHNARQSETAALLIEDLYNQYPDTLFQIAVCGSGGAMIAEAIGALFVQEVVANANAVREYYRKSRVAIELGGQDAKVIFFHHDEKTGEMVASDMRMNGSCAGGTGAFIDQVAELLNVKTEEFGKMAEAGTNVYDISGRCGVFAKTDIQPLLNQGVPKEDIALSTFHAIAKQTIGGLAQGADIRPPVIFEGGPLTFNPRLIRVFAERLQLKVVDIIIPEKAEIIVAAGAALSIGTLFQDAEKKLFRKQDVMDGLMAPRVLKAHQQTAVQENFFQSDSEMQEFRERHKLPRFVARDFKPGDVITVYLGIDAGSTTSKFVLLDEQGGLVDKFYANNAGDPLKVVQEALIALREKYKNNGVELKIKAVGTTGYGELLFAKAFKADHHTVETVSHAEAALKFAPDASFIMDIGGQDMKAISIENGIVTGIVLNEACSAGCGSFIETYAKSLKIPVENIADLAFQSKNPSLLGSRCTVFMNSSIVTEQKNGKTTEDIMAGLCKSTIENVFTKVVRVANFNSLGKTILAQGGTFKNDGVLRALEQYTGRKVIRPPYPGEMGAIGIALLTKKKIEEIEKTTAAAYQSTFIGLEGMDSFGYDKKPGQICRFCSNSCSRTVVHFNNGDTYVTGNRCEKGEIVGDLQDETTRKLLKEAASRKDYVTDLLKYRNKVFFENYPVAEISQKKAIRIGIPLVLEFWNSYPFWNALFTSLGFEVVLSGKSNYKIFENGLQNVPSDTVCFPAKLVHGHIQELAAKKVDRIFMPYLIEVKPENKKIKESINMCAIIQGYPLVIRENDEPEKKYGIPFDTPYFRYVNENLRDKQIVDYFSQTYGLPAEHVGLAIKEGDKAQVSFQTKMVQAGAELIQTLEGTNKFGVVLAGRPYHSDELVNHGLSDLFTRMGIPVFTIDSLPGLGTIDLEAVGADVVNPFHTQLFSASIYAARHPNLEVVQIVSFGCGHDAINTDEMVRILRTIADKQLLVLKLDEGDVKGPLNIRVKSFVETIKSKRKISEEASKPYEFYEIESPFHVKYEKKDIRLKTILIPNLSEAFSKVASAVMRRIGFKAETLPMADNRAVELGKKYVHNDICYPAQINVGEMLAALERGQYKPEEVTLGLAKNCDGCRAGQYMTLARKALDEAGYPQISIITTGRDNKGAHPGFKIGVRFQVGMLIGVHIIDALEEMVQKTRPYEVVKGSADALYHKYLNLLTKTLDKSYSRAFDVLDEAINAFNHLHVDRSVRKPRVFIIGEILLNYHPTANRNIVQYLENNGLETILPAFVDFFRRDIIRVKDGISKHHIPNPITSYLLAEISDTIYQSVTNRVEGSLQCFRFYEKKKTVHELAETIENFMDKTYMTGEGWLIPAEIIENAKKGVNSFVIVQPFGCLPNHITGRGLTKSLKKDFPRIQILSLDYDPDISFANIENRLQMLIMTAKELEKFSGVAPLAEVKSCI